MSDGSIVNRYLKGARFYQLRYGNADPEIVITNEISKDDFPPGQYQEFIVLDAEDILADATPAELKAMEWVLHSGLKKRSGPQRM
jgi:hypothetical protein